MRDKIYQYKCIWTITFHLKSINIKKIMAHDIGNPGPGFGQAQTCVRVKPVNGIPTFLSLEIGSQKAIQIWTNNKIPAQICFYSKRPHTKKCTITKMNDGRLILSINMYWMLQCLNYFFLGSCINPACNLWIWSKVSRLVPVEFKS